MTLPLNEPGEVMMPSFYSWTLRLLLLVALFVVISPVRAIWPEGHPASWLEVAAVGLLGLATVAVGCWAIAAWMGEARHREAANFSRQKI